MMCIQCVGESDARSDLCQVSALQCENITRREKTHARTRVTHASFKPGRKNPESLLCGQRVDGPQKKEHHTTHTGLVLSASSHTNAGRRVVESAGSRARALLLFRSNRAINNLERRKICDNHKLDVGWLVVRICYACVWVFQTSTNICCVCVCVCI